MPRPASAASTVNATRTLSTSTPRWSARPPATPPTTRPPTRRSRRGGGQGWVGNRLHTFDTGTPTPSRASGTNPEPATAHRRGNQGRSLMRDGAAVQKDVVHEHAKLPRAALGHVAHPSGPAATTGPRRRGVRGHRRAIRRGSGADPRGVRRVHLLRRCRPGAVSGGLAAAAALRRSGLPRRIPRRPRPELRIEHQGRGAAGGAGRRGECLRSAGRRGGRLRIRQHGADARRSVAAVPTPAGTTGPARGTAAVPPEPLPGAVPAESVPAESVPAESVPAGALRAAHRRPRARTGGPGLLDEAGTGITPDRCAVPRAGTGTPAGSVAAAPHATVVGSARCRTVRMGPARADAHDGRSARETAAFPADHDRAGPGGARRGGRRRGGVRRRGRVAHPPRGSVRSRSR